MPELSAGEIAAIARGVLRGAADVRVRGFVARDDAADPAHAFVAVRGGHDHVAAALNRGAPLALVERDSALPDGATGVVVADVQDALARLAIAWRARLAAITVAITGSTGKTLTKDLVTAALSGARRVHATPASYNAEIGVPLTVFGCPDDAQVLVCELAARHPGEIAELAAIVRPRIGVITGIGVAHLGEFGSREAIACTKAELLEALPDDGVALVPSTDDFLPLLCARTRARVVTVGPGGTIPPVSLRMPVPGRALLRNATFAIGVARELGVDLADAAAGIEAARTTALRMQLATLGRRTLVNDAWNANPTSLPAALRTTAELAAGRPKWAVLAHMAEIGPIAVREHRRVGRLAAALGYERVVAVGDQAAGIAEGAGAIATPVPGIEEAFEIASAAPTDAVVLVKGSRVAGLERLADRLEKAWSS